MAATLDKHDKRLDANQNVLAAVDLKVTEIERGRRLDDDRRFTMRLTIAGVLLGQLAEIVILLVKVH